MNEASRDACVCQSIGAGWFASHRQTFRFVQVLEHLNLSESVFKAQGINGKATFEALTPSRDGDLTERHETREKIRDRKSVV